MVTQMRAVDGHPAKAPPPAAVRSLRWESEESAGANIDPVSSVSIVFMGAPEPAVAVLDAVLRAARRESWTVAAVYTSPDRPSGRGRRLAPSPVRARADELGIPVLTPQRLAGPDEQARFRELGADLVILAAYGLLLPAPFLFEPRHGAVNVHPSLLPRYRGAAPVAGAILAGDNETGTSLIVMDEGLDTGPLLAQRSVPLTGAERTPELTARLFGLGGAMLEEKLPDYVAGRLKPVPQSAEGATLTRRMSKSDGDIDWREDAELIARKVRAYDPWPGTATVWEGRRLAIIAAEPLRHEGLAPGQVASVGGRMLVGAGVGALQLLRVKLEGRPETGIDEFVRGHGAFLGAQLPS